MILGALLPDDAFVCYDCKRRECGNCYTPVLQGQPLRRDASLTPAMRDAGLRTCVGGRRDGWRWHYKHGQQVLCAASVDRLKKIAPP